MSEEKEALIRIDEENGSSEEIPSTSRRALPKYGSTDKAVLKCERIIFSWSNLNVYVASGDKKSLPKDQPKKHVLKDVHGIAYPGELMAILGSSGAGKTTLLNALTFRSASNLNVTGLRCVNGLPVNSGLLRSRSGYVQQDDLFIGNLTVKEHLIFQALLRMDKEIPKAERMKRVDEVIQDLSLTKCQNTRIGVPGRIKGISGGERKRLSFASEVLTNPALLFCDEPTSGLDSYMALNVVQVLKTMAQTGKTVICTIHQPSSELYSMFDKLLLMTEGRVAFLGTPLEAEDFFASMDAPCPHNYNPADYFIQLLAIVPDREESCKQATAMICDKFEKSEIWKKNLQAATVTQKVDYSFTEYWTSNGSFQNKYKSSWCAQFSALLWRSFVTILHEPLLIQIRAYQTLLIAFLLGILFYDQELNEEGVMNLNGALFMFLTNMTFQNSFAVMNVFCSEIPVFIKEHRSGMYRTSVYFISKTIADTPIFVAVPLIFTSITYFMIGYDPDVNKFLIACGILVLVVNCAVSFGYISSCVSNNISTALTMGPPLMVPFMLFGGFFLNVNSIPYYLQWLSYLSWFRYGMELLMINQWSNVDEIDCARTAAKNISCPRNGHVVLEIYNFEEENFTFDIVMLCVIIVLFRFIAYLALLCRTLRNK